MAGQLNPVDAAIWFGTAGVGKYVQGSAKVASIFGNSSKGVKGYLREKWLEVSVNTIKALSSKKNAYID